MDRPPVSDMAMKPLLQRLVLIESPSGDPGGIGAVMDQLASELAGYGTVSRTPTDAGPCLEVSHGRGGALLLGHADTVWPRGTLQEMPWREEGDWVYGPGTLDMKGGLVLAVEAIRRLDPGVPFAFLVTPDEEVGSAHSRDLIEERARAAPLVLVLESGMPEGAIKVGRAGVGAFSLEIEGIESHAGLDPYRGASAVRELSRQVMWLETLENRALATTLNVGVVAGGTRPNVVPGRAHASLDVRVTTAAEMHRIAAAFQSPPRFDERCQVRYRGAFNRPPMEPTPESQKWVARASQIWQSLTGEPLRGVRVGGASDGNFTAPLSPTLDGLGPVGQGAHARHEGVDWRYMNLRLQLIERLLREAGAS